MIVKEIINELFHHFHVGGRPTGRSHTWLHGHSIHGQSSVAVQLMHFTI